MLPDSLGPAGRGAVGCGTVGERRGATMARTPVRAEERASSKRARPHRQEKPTVPELREPRRFCEAEPHFTSDNRRITDDVGIPVTDC